MKKFHLLSILLVFTVLSSAQSVTNVTAVQVGKTIEIAYDLDKAADITVYMSTSGGATYRELRKVSGDVGKTVGPGHKTVVWDVIAEIGELINDDVMFMVRASETDDDRRKRQNKENISKLSTFATVNVAFSSLPQWSCGFKVGQMKVVGWYVSAMSNFQYKGMFHPIQEGGMYDLSGKQKTTRLSVQAGLVIRPIKPFSLLFGVGYGYRTLSVQTTNGEWFCYPLRTYHGVDASFGFLFNIKGFALSTEATTTNFKTLELNIGIGFCLDQKRNNSN